jgi:hypothetical protein
MLAATYDESPSIQTDYRPCPVVAEPAGAVIGIVLS